MSCAITWPGRAPFSEPWLCALLCQPPKVVTHPLESHGALRSSVAAATSGATEPRTEAPHSHVVSHATMGPESLCRTGSAGGAWEPLVLEAVLSIIGPRARNLAVGVTPVPMRQ